MRICVHFKFVPCNADNDIPRDLVAMNLSKYPVTHIIPDVHVFLASKCANDLYTEEVAHASSPMSHVPHIAHRHMNIGYLGCLLSQNSKS